MLVDRPRKFRDQISKGVKFEKYEGNERLDKMILNNFGDQATRNDTNHLRHSTAMTIYGQNAKASVFDSPPKN